MSVSARLGEISASKGNECCADCSAPDPGWASISFGILICIQCAGIHRSLGVHISRVRSITLDEWEEEHIQALEQSGNTVSNQKYLASVPDDVKIPGPNSSQKTMTEWIRQKYISKMFMSTTERIIEEQQNPVHVPDFLTIEVGNPTTAQDPNGNSYTTYEIKTMTNLEEYPGEEFVVHRRYNEFLNLFKWMKTQEIPGLPKMPEKRFFDRFSADVVEQRVQDFNRILKWASTQAKIRKSNAFIQFITVN